MTPEEYGQYYGQMNTMNPHTMRTMKQQHEGLPYEEMGYCPPPNRKLPPVPGQHSNYNTIDRIKNGNKKVQNGYATWDPRKNKTGEVPQYDEIPYGDVGPPGVGPQAQGQGFVDGHSGKGQLPQVPAEYSQVPNIPQRQVGGSMVQNEEDISPYATFHLLGMREENKNGGNPNPQNQFKTLQPNQSGPGTMMGGPPPGMVQQTGPMGGTQTGPNTPAHQRQIQTMNPRRSLAGGPPIPMAGQQGPMPPIPPQQNQQGMIYDAPNCDYDPPSYMDQNFGNPYDCPEGMYNGSMMSSVGYSQVSDHANTMGLPNMAPGMPGGMPNFPPQAPRGQQMGGQPLPGMTALPPPPSQQQQQLENFNPGNTDTVIFKPEGRGASHIAGLAGQQQPVRNIPQQFEDDAFPPPPPVRPGNGNTTIPSSADVSLNDSASTTQSNVTSECSEAECDREPLVKQSSGAGGNRASVGSPRDLTTEEMRKLLERNEVVQGGGQSGLQPFDLGNV